MLNPKQALDKIAKVIEAWQDLAKEKSFGGMTLEQFKDRVKPSMDTRTTLMAVKNARIDAQTTRSQSDLDSLKALQLVVAGIKADSTESEDGALYKACGYVRKSERKTGLSRKTKAAQPPA